MFSEDLHKKNGVREDEHLRPQCFLVEKKMIALLLYLQDTRNISYETIGLITIGNKWIL